MINETELLKKILYNPYIRNKFLNYEENKEIFYKNDKEELIKKLIKLMQEEIKNMDEYSFDIELILSWYECLLKDYYINEDTYMIFHDPLIKLIQDKLIAYNIDVTSYTTYISELQLYVLNNGKHNKCLYKYLEYKNQSYLLNEEFERYVYALNELNCYEEDDYYYIFNMILDKLYTLTDDTYRKMFHKFGLFVLKEFDLNEAKLNLTDKLPNGVEGNCDSKNQIIKINNKYLNYKNTVENLNTLFHEIKHVLQTDEENILYRIDIIKRLEDNILMGYIYNEVDGKNNIYYTENYRNIVAETDANICSRMYLLKFLEIYAPLTYRLQKEQIEAKLKEYTLLESDDNRLTIFSNENDLQMLFAYELQKHPEIMYGDILTAEQKMILLQVYDTNCKPKTPNKYFDEKARILEQMSKIPLEEEQALNDLKKKLDFYDGVLSTFKYSRENLIRNLLSLKDYKSTNDEITMEAMQYAEEIKQQLELYEQLINSGDINGRNKK